MLEGGLDPAAWSGSYAGLAAGLRAHAVEVVPVNMAAPIYVERVLRRLPGWRAHSVLHQALVDVRLRRAHSLDAILSIGSSATVRTSLPLATYEDMTVRQGLAVGDPWVASRPASELRAWVRRQSVIYARAGRVLTMGSWAADSIVRDYGVPRERVRVVGAGVNHVAEPASRDWSKPRFLFVGRDFERKNGAAVVRAFAALRAERPDAQLDVVGVHPPLDLPGVVGHGPLAIGDAEDRARMNHLLSQSTCFVMPSRYEPFGIVYAEAATAGIPSIATTVGGTFVNEGCGRRVDPTDDAALLDAMRELADGERARALGERARRRAALFTWPMVAGRVVRCFGELLGRSVDGLPAYL